MYYNESLTELKTDGGDLKHCDLFWNVDHDFTLQDQIKHPSNSERRLFNDKLDFDFFTTRILSGFSDSTKNMVYNESLRIYHNLLKCKFKTQNKEDLILNIIEEVLLDLNIDIGKTDLHLFK